MAVPFLTSIDLNRNELLNSRLQNVGADPTGLTAADKGLIWVSGSVIKYWDGVATQTLGLSSGGDASTLGGNNGAFYLDRANHTGTQTASTISDLPEATQDIVGGMLGGTQTGIAVTYDDATGLLSFVSEGETQYVSSVTDTATLDLTVSAGGALSGAVLDAPTVGGATPAQLRDRSTHTGTQTSGTISDFAEAAQDSVGTILTDTATLDFTYNDAGPTISGTVLDSPTVGGATPAQLRDRSTHTGTQAISTVTNLQTALDAKVDDSQLGVANGVATLGADTKIPAAQLPALALTDVNVVADIAARNALTVEEGDVAIVLTTAQTFIYDGTAWQEMVSPTDGVTAVTGGTGITSSGGTTPSISITPGGVGDTQLGTGAVNLAGTKVTGILPATAGGTGQSTYAVGNLLIGGASNTLTKLAPVATGNALISGGTTAAPTWGKIGLATHVSGTLPVANGGTGATTAAAARTALGTPGKFTANIGGAGTEYVVTHNLNTRDVNVQVYRNSTPWDTVMVDVERTTVNTVTVRFAQTQAVDAFRVVVTG